MDRVSTAVTIVMLAIFATMVAVALTYSTSARFMPLVVGLPAIVLCLIQLAVDLSGRRRRSAKASETRELGPHTRAAEIRNWAWFAGFIAVVLLIGFQLAGPLLVFGYLWREAGVRPGRAALAAALFAAWIHGMFVVLLGFELHGGLWGRAILGTVGL